MRVYHVSLALARAIERRYCIHDDYGASVFLMDKISKRLYWPEQPGWKSIAMPLTPSTSFLYPTEIPAPTCQRRCERRCRAMSALTQHLLVRFAPMWPL